MGEEKFSFLISKSYHLNHSNKESIQKLHIGDSSLYTFCIAFNAHVVKAKASVGYKLSKWRQIIS